MDLDRLRRLEKPVCFGCAAALAILYLWWQYTYNHWIANYTWMVPFGIGYGIPLFWFSLKITRAEQALRDPGLPEARAVTAPPAAEPAPVPVVAPAEVRPSDPTEGPRLLK